MHKSFYLTLAALAVLILAVISSGCTAVMNPTPDEVKIRTNVIAVEPNYISNDVIWALLLNPNDYKPELFEAIDEYLPRENPAIELEAGIGAVSAYINDKLYYPFNLISVEPNPNFMNDLQRTKQMNQLGCVFLEGTIGYNGNVSQITLSNNIMGKSMLAGDRVETGVVKSYKLEDIVNMAAFTQKDNLTLVISTPGKEMSILQNEGDYLSSKFGTIIALITPEGNSAVSSFNLMMSKLGYNEVKTSPDPNGRYTLVVYTKDVEKKNANSQSGASGISNITTLNPVILPVIVTPSDGMVVPTSTPAASATGTASSGTSEPRYNGTVIRELITDAVAEAATAKPSNSR